MSRLRSVLATGSLALTLTLGAMAASAQESAPDAQISFSSVGLNVADIPRAEAFYTEVFGMVRTFQYPPEGEPIEVGLARPGQPGGMGLLLANFTDDPLPEGKSAYGRIVITTDDAYGLADRAVAAGAKMLRDVGPAGGPIILFLADLDGYEFELYQPAPAPESQP